MNCKPGDLAIIVKSWAGNEGKIVQCVKYLGILATSDAFGNTTNEPCWAIDRPLQDAVGGVDNILCDDQLRPIRPQPDDAVDEVIQRIGTPHKEVA